MKIQDAVDYGKGIPNKIFDDEGNVFNRVEVNYPYMTLIAYKSQDKNIKINLLSKYLITTATFTTLSLLISGCAMFPSNEELVKPKTLSQYETKNSFENKNSILWPKEDWWTIYDDLQLNELIKEALADSPNIISAQARLKQADAFTQVNKSSNLPQVSANAQVTEEKHSYNYIFC